MVAMTCCSSDRLISFIISCMLSIGFFHLHQFFDDFFYFLIACTTANVRIQPFLNRFIVCLWMVFQERMTVQDKPRCTIATLDSPVVDEGVLDVCIL